MLEVRDLSKRFGALTVTQAVNLRLAPGARHALIGPNGAGKTTLINLLTGTLPSDGGSVRLDGADITRATPQARVQRGLARTYQINSLFRDLTPLQSVALAIAQREGYALHFGRLGARGRQAGDEAAALLDSVGLRSHLQEPTRAMPYGQQRLLEVALALACKPKVLLLDEPAAGVSTAASQRLFEVIDRLPAELAILLIEHDMRLVFRFASRISVLVAGAVLVEGAPAEIAADPRVREVYLGARMLLEVDALLAGHGDALALHHISLSLPEGQGLAVLGRNGAGKTTLLETLMGLTTWHAGEIRFAGRSLRGRSPAARARAGLGWVPQEREVFAPLTVEENLTVVRRRGPWTLARVYELFPRLRERRSNLGSQLSGGEQQMLAIGRALMTNPGLLLLDEPMEGLAPIVVEELAAAVAGMVRSSGLAVIVVEQHPVVALSMTTQALILEQGRVVHRAASAELRGDDATLDRYLGVGADEADEAGGEPSSSSRAPSRPLSDPPAGERPPNTHSARSPE